MSATASASTRRRDTWLAALVCLVFALAFARNPIAHLHDGVWSPADISQVFSLTRVTDGWRPGNELMSDVWLQMNAWLQFQRDELHAGRLPLWNPWNGNGVPQLANYQSAVLSPFSVPYYVLPFALAVIVASVAKLFGLAFFTFLFLRELRLAFSASMLGALVFAYAGHNVILIGYPHSSVAMFLPATLFLVERIVQRTALHDATRPWWRAATPVLFAWLVVDLVLLQLAGHPETLFFVLLVTAAYAVMRLVAAWRDAHSDEARWNTLVLGAQIVVCGLAAALIGSVQTLPFFEYLHDSAILGARTGRQIPLGLRTWSALFFPNELGNPSSSYYVDAALPRPDFTIATMGYIGGTATLTALTAFLFVTKRRACAFFAGGFVLWFLYAYGVGGTGVIWHHVPGLSMAPINRSQIVGAFCVACLAAFAADFLVRGKRNFVAAAFALVVGGGILFFARINAASVVELTRRFLPTEEKRALLVSGSAEHLARMTPLLAAGVIVLAIAWILPRGWKRVACVWAIALIGYAGTGALLKGYMPLCNAHHFFPVTPAIQQWKAAAGDRQVTVLGDDTLPPCENIVYGIRQAACYDALGIGRYERLYVRHFGSSVNWMLARKATARGLQMFGIDAVLDGDGWLDVDTAFDFVAWDPKAFVGTGELVRGSEVVQDFTGVRDGLDSIRVRFERPAQDPACTVDIALEDASSGAVIARQTFSTATMNDSAPDELAATLRCAPIEGSRERHLRLRAASKDGAPGRAFVLRARSDWDACVAQALGSPGTHAPAEGWKLSRDGQPLSGGLYLDLGFADHAFHPEAPVGRFTLYRFERANSRYHVVADARWSDDAEDSWKQVDAPDFDPARSVVIERDAAPLPPAMTSTAAASRSVTLDAEIPGRIRLHVAAGESGWLVTAQPWYPGWVARVNGAAEPIRRADYAFSAIRLPASACDVELEYTAPAFRLACKLATAAILALAVWLFVSHRALRPSA